MTLILLSVKQGGIKYHFLSLTRPGIEPRSPGRLANTLTARPMSGFICIYIYKNWRPEDSLFNRGVEEGATPFPGLLHFALDTYLIMQGGIKYLLGGLSYDSAWD